MGADSNLIPFLTTFIASTNELIKNAREIVKRKGIEAFAKSDMGMFLAMLFSYKSLFESTDARTEEEFSRVLQKGLQASRGNSSKRSSEVTPAIMDLDDAVEEFFKAEISWEEFLLTLDHLLKNVVNESALSVTEKIREINLESLSDANHVAAAEAAIPQLTAHQCQVIIVSFGERRGAQVWQQETKCQFPIYLDQDRKLYSSLGMKRSFSNVWGKQDLVYYSEQMLQNRTLPQPVQDVVDDALQMGGDIIFDQRGYPGFTYLSKSSSDRPTVSSVMSYLQSS
ncbi:unnamed protein product [Allacma fusca]|uniref:Uncharacterized protein n=1 Tax=Allacma fusca TaxID=39272 RepID=A0A8J2PM34_9HEXA|nr:unnamed protein product [Allacma fusca]